MGSPRRSRARFQATKEGFRSAFEQTVAKDLDNRGIKYEYEAKTFKFYVPFRNSKCAECGSKRVGRITDYTPDFHSHAFGYVETKGKLDSRTRTRMAAYAQAHKENPASYPAVRILFQADNWLTKRHKQRYSDWARKTGFECATGKRIPDEWIAKP